ncbi:MAG: aminopeptidase P family protein [Lachnospiraceae bacterium]|nr:aminopeptidase P family protein [Lachnospiraceae bacterium]
MKTPGEELAFRLAKVRRAMEEAGVEALVTGSSAQYDHRGMLRYLTDYYISVFEEFLVIHTDGPVVFFAHDASGVSYMEELGAVDEVRPIPGEEYTVRPGKCVAEYLKERRISHVGLAGLSGLSAAFYRSFTEAAEGLLQRDMTRELWQIRMRKSPYEMALSREAIRLNEEVFRYYLTQVAAGKTEYEAIQRAAAYGWEAGCEDQYWLADTGKGTLCRPLPLVREKGRIWQVGDMHGVVMEHSAAGGHYSELSRHLSIGREAPAFTAAYEALAQAQEEAFAVMRPGNTVGQVAEAVETSLRKTVFGARYAKRAAPLSMGHGQGLDVWEYPRIIRGDETLLASGMRLNLHPSVELPDGTSVSFCDLYGITEKSAEKLSSLEDRVYRV